MTESDDVLAAARRAVAEQAQRYGSVEPIREGPDLAGMAARLSEWAVLDPSGYDVRSIRRLGAPITMLKRLLLRLLVQFHAQQMADVSRFNVLLLGYVRTLEARVVELERRLEADTEDAAPDAIEDDWA